MCATEVPARIHSGSPGMLRRFEELTEEEEQGTIWGPVSCSVPQASLLQMSATVGRSLLQQAPSHGRNEPCYIKPLQSVS